MAAPAIGRLVQVMRQSQPVPTFVTPPTWVDVVALVANTAQNYIIPAGAFIRCTPTVIPTYGNLNGAAALPSAGVVNGSASFPVGGQSYFCGVEPGATLSLICGSACYVTIEVWK